MAWTLQHPAVASTLIGAKSPEHVKALAGSEDWRLGERELAEIDAIARSLPHVASEAEVTTWDHVSDERLSYLGPPLREREAHGVSAHRPAGGVVRAACHLGARRP